MTSQKKDDPPAKGIPKGDKRGKHDKGEAKGKTGKPGAVNFKNFSLIHKAKIKR